MICYLDLGGNVVEIRGVCYGLVCVRETVVMSVHVRVGVLSHFGNT